MSVLKFSEYGGLFWTFVCELFSANVTDYNIYLISLMKLDAYAFIVHDV